MDFTPEQQAILMDGELGQKVDNPDLETLKKYVGQPLAFADPVSGVERRGILELNEDSGEVQFTGPNKWGGEDSTKCDHSQIQWVVELTQK